MMIDYLVPIVTEKLINHLSMKTFVIELQVKKAIEEGYDRQGRVLTEGDIYYYDLEGFAVHNCTFYECNKCSEPYFGGMQDCSQAMQSESSLKKEELLCQKCVTQDLGFG